MVQGVVTRYTQKFENSIESQPPKIWNAISADFDPPPLWNEIPVFELWRLPLGGQVFVMHDQVGMADQVDVAMTLSSCCEGFAELPVQYFVLPHKIKFFI